MQQTTSSQDTDVQVGTAVPASKAGGARGGPRRQYASDNGASAAHRGRDSGFWRARPGLAMGLRVLISFAPVGAAALVTVLLREFVLRPFVGPGVWPHVAGYAGLVAATALVAWVVERQARRFLPLVALLRLSLLFPDQAPARFKLARTAGNPAALQAMAHAGGGDGGAAAAVLHLLGQLSIHERHTRGHSERVRVYADLIGEQLGLCPADRDRLRLAALVHDIGKLTVPAEVLRKPGRPSEAEWALLQEHPVAGVELAGGLVEWLGPWVGGITEHHERFDGAGYPHGVSGLQISLAGRIVAVADAFETMTAARS